VQFWSTTIARGQLWWAELPSPTGSEPGFNRPALIIQADNFNRSRISTVVVVAITTSVALVKAPGNVRLLKSKTGLAKDSIANISQIVTLDKASLTEVIGVLDRLTMQQVDEGIALALGL
jgi:mRNA interferase MazF